MYRAAPRRELPEFSDLVLACRYHWRKTLVFGILTSTFFSIIACCFIVPTYEAESFVRVRQHQDVVFAAQSTRADDLAFVRAQEQLALSPQVINATWHEPDLGPYHEFIPIRDSADWLKSLVSVDMQTGSEVLRIAVRHPVPEVAQAICNALTHAYIYEVTQRLVSDQDRRQVELERAAKAADRQLDELWAELSEVALQVGSDSPQSLTIRDEIQLQAYRDYSQQLRAVQMRGRELSMQLEDSKREAAARTSRLNEEEITALIENAPEIIAARDRVAILSAQVRQMHEIVANDDSPRLQRLIEERDFYEAELQRITAEVSPRIRKTAMDQTEEDVTSTLGHLEKQIELNNTETDFLRNRLAEFDTSTLRADDKNGLQLEVSRHAVDRQAGLADGLWQSLEELKIERQSQIRVQLLDLAQLPVSASRAKQIKALAAVVGTCWIVIVLGTGYFEWRSCTIRHTADVIEHSRFPTFGTIEQEKKAFIGRRGSSHLTTGAQDFASHILISRNPASAIPTFMVTSATREEPRQQLGIDIARAFAALHEPTLLIDFDTTCNRLSRKLGCEAASGLVECCSASGSPMRFVLRSEEGVDFLPLGNANEHNPRIAPERFAKALRSLRTRYTSIIIVGPSILDAAEGLVNAAQADRILFAVAGSQSRWNELAQAEYTAVRAGLCCFGSVMHAANSTGKLSIGTVRQATSYTANNDPESEIESEVREDLSALKRNMRRAMITHFGPGNSTAEVRQVRESDR